MTRSNSLNLVPEAEILETWPMLPAAMLRKARRKGEVVFYQFPGGPHYKILDVEEFIERKFKVCVDQKQQSSPPPEPLPPIPRPPVGNMAVTTSTTLTPSEVDTGTPADTMSENDRLRAEVFAQRISNRRKDFLSQSQTPTPPQKTKLQARKKSSSQ